MDPTNLQGGNDNPPPYHPGDWFSGGSSSQPSSSGSQRANSIRDQLQRMNTISSTFKANKGPANPMVEEIHSDLVRLQEIILELRLGGKDGGSAKGPAAENSIPRELEKQIEELFDQVRNNLRLVGDEDEQILRGNDVHRRNASGETALHIAARRRPVDLDLIRTFLNLGASPSDDGWTALSRVTHDLDSTVAQMLLKHGADVNTSTLGLLTPLHRAAKTHSLYILQMLLSHSANPNAVSANGETPLSIVCQLPYAHFRTQASMAELLLTAGARPDAGPPGAKRPLDAVIKAAHENEVRLSNLQWSDSNLDCFVWGREDLEQRMNTMNVLFGHSDKITLHDSTRNLVPQMYTFRRMRDLEGIPIVDLRRRFRERIGEIVVLSDKEFYDDMRHLV
ncbi:ankyrin repeat-containing domain protein [Hyaloscypha finlandica]|nr:ankyrin repeat-containing domain protein [Hyaloscypha finlandica]